jgi:hypothetical protein
MPERLTVVARRNPGFADASVRGVFAERGSLFNSNPANT